MKLRLISTLLILAAMVPEASAESLDVNLQVVEPEKAKADDGAKSDEDKGDKDKKDKGLPSFRAVVTARPGLTKKDFTLKSLDAEPPLEVPASRSVTFKESDEAMTLVVLVQGNYRWMGNESYADPETGTVYDGAFKGLGPAIDTLAKMGPKSSRGALLVYGGEVTPKQPMGDISELSGGALGSQQEYSEFISKPFVAGLTEAWKLFTKPEEADNRKILVVVGDGFDDNADIASALRKAIDDLKTAGVETYTIHYTASMDDGPQGQQNMKKLGYSGHYNATSRSEFDTYAGNIAQLVGAKYYVDFAGDDITFDGKEHEFSVKVGDEESEPALLQLPLVEKKKEEEGSLWWLWLLLILLVVVIVVVIIIVKRRGAAEEPVAPPMEAPPPAAPAPQKTIMLGVGGSEDAMPIVGWVVPLGGPNQYQTFKLLQGATKLGTGGEAHIVVSDTFMSTEHAEIVCAANGFTLNDLNSTNGTFVNDMRVSSHELVDNDVFRLGKTDFKFKSIN